MKPIIITISILLAGLTIATLNLLPTNAELKEQLQTALGYRLLYISAPPHYLRMWFLATKPRLSEYYLP